MLVVFGASGGVGREVVSQASQAGLAVRAVYRRAQAVPIHVSGVEAHVVASVTDSRALADALAGAQAVISCLGLRRRFPLNPWSAIVSPLDLTSRFAQCLVEALTGTPSVPLVTVSAAGVAESRACVSGVVRLLIERTNLAPAYADLEVMERVLHASRPDAVCVRPTTLSNGAATGRSRISPRYGLFSWISRADVAAYLIDRSQGRRDADGRTPLITVTG
jgi:uncharacterized protein YbjT (DUF2867 family)